MFFKEIVTFNCQGLNNTCQGSIFKVITWWRQSWYCVRSCYCIPKPIPSSFSSSFTEFGRKYNTGRTLLFFYPIQKMYSNLYHTSTHMFCFPPRLVGKKTWRRMLLFWTGTPPNAPAQADEGFPDEFQQTEEKCSKLLNTVFSTSQVIIIVIIIIFLECLGFAFPHAEWWFN